MESNEKIIERYLQDLRDGKPIRGRKQKPLGRKTCQKYKNYLKRFSEEWFKKPFDKVTEQDVSEFRKKLKENIYRRKNGTILQDNSKRDIEYKCLGKFFKWFGKPELIYFTDDYKGHNEIETISRTDVESMISTSKLRDKVILTILYDAGVRAQEFLNLTFKDLKDDLRKAKGYYKLRIRISKTKPRTIGLYLEKSTEILDQWLEENQDKVGTDERLVSISYNHLCKTLRRIGDRTLKRKVYPHLLRHSSATYYAHKLNKFQMCYRYGWSMSSKMVDIYIDREGLMETEVAEKIADDDAMKYKKEVNLLKEQLRMMEERQKKYEDALEFVRLKKKATT